MLYNYFKIAWRNLLKRKFYAAVNIFGLAVGMTFSFLIASYVWSELQVNSDLREAEQQYIVRSKWKNPDNGIDLATLGPIGKALKDDYPNLVAGYYRYDGITVAVSKGDKHFREDVQTGDSTLLSMYGFPLLHGDAATAMQQPNSVVITEEKAIKYFGKTDVIGQALTLHNFIGGKQEYQVTGVLSSLPHNSATHLLGKPAEIFIPLGTLGGRSGAEKDWNFPYMITFVRLKPGVTVADLEKPVKQLLSTHASQHVRENLSIYFTPLKAYYREANGGLVNKMMLTLSGVTAFILLMAVVNFINISIGHSTVRLKEIGVRKVLGSLRRQLVGQFLAESILLAAIAALFSIGLYELTRPLFSTVLEKPIASVILLFPFSLLLPLLFVLIIGSLAGLYPAFILSGLPSIDSMKGKLKSVKENIWFRRVLIVSQFSIAIFVFAASAVISKQIGYFFSKNPGFEKNWVVSVAVPRDWTPEGLARMEANRNEFLRLKEVQQASLSYEIPNGNHGGEYGIYKMGKDSTEAITAKFLTTDEHFTETYGIKMLAGQFFSQQSGTVQPDHIVLNRAATKALGFRNPEEAVGQQVRIHYFSAPMTIGGITQDFQFESMHNAIKPIAFLHVRGNSIYRYLTFRLQPAHVSESIRTLEAKWRVLMPDAPFEYTFMDETLRKLYQSEIQLQKASQIATVLAIVIVLLGVLGMVSMNVSRRTREVGIRKVLGASGMSIILLFLKEFLLVMLLASVTAFPIAIFTMKKWLENYAFRINISWQIVAFVGLTFAALIIPLVCIQTYKAAIANPVKSLKAD